MGPGNEQFWHHCGTRSVFPNSCTRSARAFSRQGSPVCVCVCVCFVIQDHNDLALGLSWFLISLPVTTPTRSNVTSSHPKTASPDPPARFLLTHPMFHPHARWALLPIVLGTWVALPRSPAHTLWWMRPAARTSALSSPWTGSSSPAAVRFFVAAPPSDG